MAEFRPQPSQTGDEVTTASRIGQCPEDLFKDAESGGDSSYSALPLSVFEGITSHPEKQRQLPSRRVAILAGTILVLTATSGVIGYSLGRDEGGASQSEQSVYLPSVISTPSTVRIVLPFTTTEMLPAPIVANRRSAGTTSTIPTTTTTTTPPETVPPATTLPPETIPVTEPPVIETSPPATEETSPPEEVQEVEQTTASASSNLGTEACEALGGSLQPLPGGDTVLQDHIRQLANQAGVSLTEAQIDTLIFGTNYRKRYGLDGDLIAGNQECQPISLEPLKIYVSVFGKD